MNSGQRLRRDPEVGFVTQENPIRFFLFYVMIFTSIGKGLRSPCSRDPELGVSREKPANAARRCLFYFPCLQKQVFDARKIKKPDKYVWLFSVGVAGFEPATSCSQSSICYTIFKCFKEF